MQSCSKESPDRCKRSLQVYEERLQELPRGLQESSHVESLHEEGEYATALTLTGESTSNVSLSPFLEVFVKLHGRYLSGCSGDPSNYSQSREYQQ